MESISSFIGDRVFEKKPFNRKEDLNQRALLVKEFVEKLNEEREGTKYKALKPSYVGMRVSHLDTWDLALFLGQCKDSKHFSKKFFWALKVK